MSDVNTKRKRIFNIEIKMAKLKKPTKENDIKEKKKLEKKKLEIAGWPKQTQT